MHITSLIVDVLPACLQRAQRELAGLPGVDVHAYTAEGKVVVTIETETDAQSSDAFARIGRVPGVMSLALVFHQFEPEPEHECEA